MLVFCNLLLALVFTIKDDLLTETDSRFQLPNYMETQARAKQHFQEFADLEMTYQPFVEWRRKPYQGQTITIDSTGCRQHQKPLNTLESDTAVKYVHFFGGSTMWGTGVDDNHTIPALCQKQHPNWRIYNHGEINYNSRQNLETLINLLTAGERIDLAIFYDGVNDVSNLCRKEVTLPGHCYETLFRQKITAKTPLWQWTYELCLSNFFRLAAFLAKKLGSQNTKDLYACCPTCGIRAEKVSESMLNNWEVAQTLVTKQGGIFLGIFQPVSFIGNSRIKHLSPLDPHLRIVYHSVYPKIQKRLRKMQNPWFYDLSTAFDNQNAYIYIDFCHVSANGNQIIADSLNNILASVLK